jgi:hypothetical protein
LLLYSSKPSLGVYQLAGHLLQANKFSDTIITTPSTSFLAPLPGKSGRPLQGEFFARTSFTLLLFCFILFILPASIYIKNPKKIRIVGSCYFFTLVYYV